MLRRLSFRLSLLPALGLALAGSTLAQNTWFVDDDATPPGNGTLASPYASIQYALDQPATASGDLVLVAPGTYAGNISIGKSITVRASAGPLETVIQTPPGAYGVLLPESASATIEGFSILGNTSPMGTSGVFFERGFVKRCIIRGHRPGTHNYGFGVDGELVAQNGFSAVQLCTMVDNDVGAWGPALGIFRVDSSIMYGNKVLDAAAIDGQHCTFGTGGGGGGTNNNILGDPRLWDLDALDVHLRPDSHCIDSGNPGFPPDPDGSRADRGAVPFDPLHVPFITTYCTSKINSQGCVAAIGSSGGAGASMSSSSPFLVTCTGVVEGVPGLLFWGHAPRALPFMGGFHCVQPPTPRTGGQLAGTSGSPCSGTFSFDFNAYAQSGLNPTLAAGQAIYAQYWYRDATLPPFFADTSDAIAFPLGP